MFSMGVLIERGKSGKCIKSKSFERNKVIDSTPSLFLESEMTPEYAFSKEQLEKEAEEDELKIQRFKEQVEKERQEKRMKKKKAEQEEKEFKANLKKATEEAEKRRVEFVGKYSTDRKKAEVIGKIEKERAKDAELEKAILNIPSAVKPENAKQRDLAQQQRKDMIPKKSPIPNGIFSPVPAAKKVELTTSSCLNVTKKLCPFYPDNFPGGIQGYTSPQSLKLKQVAENKPNLSMPDLSKLVLKEQVVAKEPAPPKDVQNVVKIDVKKRAESSEQVVAKKPLPSKDVQNVVKMDVKKQAESSDSSDSSDSSSDDEQLQEPLKCKDSSEEELSTEASDDERSIDSSVDEPAKKSESSSSSDEDRDSSDATSSESESEEVVEETDEAEDAQLSQSSKKLQELLEQVERQKRETEKIQQEVQRVAEEKLRKKKEAEAERKKARQQRIESKAAKKEKKRLLEEKKLAEKKLEEERKKLEEEEKRAEKALAEKRAARGKQLKRKIDSVGEGSFSASLDQPPPAKKPRKPDYVAEPKHKAINRKEDLFKASISLQPAEKIVVTGQLAKTISNKYKYDEIKEEKAKKDFCSDQRKRLRVRLNNAINMIKRGINATVNLEKQFVMMLARDGIKQMPRLDPSPIKLTAMRLYAKRNNIRFSKAHCVGVEETIDWFSREFDTVGDAWHGSSTSNKQLWHNENDLNFRGLQKQIDLLSSKYTSYFARNK